MIYWLCCVAGWVTGFKINGYPTFETSVRHAANFSSFEEADAFGKAHIKGWYVIVQPAVQGVK